MWVNDLLVGSEISWWFPNILPLESGLIGMVPKNLATRARINRYGSHSSGSEISCDTGPGSSLVAELELNWTFFHIPYLLELCETAHTGLAVLLGPSIHDLPPACQSTPLPPPPPPPPPPIHTQPFFFFFFFWQRRGVDLLLLLLLF